MVNNGHWDWQIDCYVVYLVYGIEQRSPTFLAWWTGGGGSGGGVCVGGEGMVSHALIHLPLV